MVLQRMVEAMERMRVEIRGLGPGGIIIQVHPGIHLCRVVLVATSGGGTCASYSCSTFSANPSAAATANG